MDIKIWDILLSLYYQEIKFEMDLEKENIEDMEEETDEKCNHIIR